MKEEYKYSDLTAKIIGAAFEVHNGLGNGFQEKIYQRALEVEFQLQSIDYKREFEMEIWYKGVLIGKRSVDFLIDDKIGVELKAVIQLEDAHLAQGLNYLEVYNLEIGLLLNFGASSLQIKRLLNKKFSPIEQVKQNKDLD
jgi:GxxExxY protein